LLPNKLCRIVIALVAEEPVRIDVVQLHQRIAAFDLMRFAAGHVESQRVALGVRAEMDFSREAAVRAAERFLILIPPFTPAASADKEHAIDSTTVWAGRAAIPLKSESVIVIVGSASSWRKPAERRVSKFGPDRRTKIPTSAKGVSEGGPSRNVRGQS